MLVILLDAQHVGLMDGSRNNLEQIETGSRTIFALGSRTPSYRLYTASSGVLPGFWKLAMGMK